MHSIVYSLVLIFIFFKINETVAAENGYVFTDYNELIPPCKNASEIVPTNSSCAEFVNYRMPDYNRGSTDLSRIRDMILKTEAILRAVANEKCVKAVKKYLCMSSYPFRCNDDFIEAGGKELAVACNESRKDCSGLNTTLPYQFLNCSHVTNNPAFQKRFPRKIMCVAFPELNDDPFSCEANYKVH